jgi:hypothetical protein
MFPVMDHGAIDAASVSVSPAILAGFRSMLIETEGRRFDSTRVDPTATNPAFRVVIRLPEG